MHAEPVYPVRIYWLVLYRHLLALQIHIVGPPESGVQIHIGTSTLANAVSSPGKRRLGFKTRIFKLVINISNAAVSLDKNLLRPAVGQERSRKFV